MSARQRNKNLLNELEVDFTEMDEKSIGSYEGFFEMTPQGMPFNISEYGTWIADTRESKAGQVFLEE